MKTAPENVEEIKITTGKLVEGVLEISEKGHGYLRSLDVVYKSKSNDPFIHREMIQKWGMRDGLVIKARAVGKAKGRGNGPRVEEILFINDCPPDEYHDIVRFENFTVIDPEERIRLEYGKEPLGPRVIDMLTPIGRGQRGLIVAPPRTGKTILLQQIANGVHCNHPEIEIMVLLVDERPEEVTDMCRNIPGEVIASSNDKPLESHIRTAKLALNKAKRKLEFGKDVLVLLDSITRLGRAFNAWVSSSGRTMSGGVDVHALQLPKQIFGSARNVEEGGSLTIIATALIETGSRMDDVIFQEFKGTGNMELVLDRQLANRRIFPAIDISQSGTRKEERLIPGNDLAKINRLRRHLNSLQVGQDVTMLLRAMEKHKSNKDFLRELP